MVRAAAWRDADLLGFGPDDVPSLVAVFRSICGIVVDDGIVFDSDSVIGTEIRKQAGYGGVRVDVRATLDGARIALQVDIGFGDAVTPSPQSVLYPTPIAEVPAPTPGAYPKATVVAEKLHALCVLGMANSRMKDYFDLWVLLHDEELDDNELRLAIATTFARRQRALPTELPVGLSDGFAADRAKQVQWHAFFQKNRLEAPELKPLVAWLRVRLQRTGFPSIAAIS